MEILDREKYTILFEKFQLFLTQTQRQALQLYLFEDLGISEIAAETATTRQAIYDAVKKGMKKLDEINAKIEE